MSLLLIQSIIRDFHIEPLPIYFERNISIPLNSQKIITFIGPRRSGKTAQLFNTMHALLAQDIPKPCYTSI